MNTDDKEQTVSLDIMPIEDEKLLITTRQNETSIPHPMQPQVLSTPPPTQSEVLHIPMKQVIQQAPVQSQEQPRWIRHSSYDPDERILVFRVSYAIFYPVNPS